MKRAVIIPALLGMAWAVAPTASAEESDLGPSLEGRTVAAPDRALEVGVSTGFNQGFGDLQGGQPMSRFASSGLLGEIAVGYRASPRLMVGLYGSAAQLGPHERLAQLFASDTAVRSATAGVQAHWHFRPFRAVDPWVGVGAGWRGFWLVPEQSGSVSRQGLDLVRARVGLDFRFSRQLSLGPVAGADASMMLGERVPGGAFTHIPHPAVTGFAFIGISGRFDTRGSVRSADVASR